MSFYLVQRLQRPFDGVNERKKGFDRHFDLDYMGSAEYEFSTPNESLKRMRAKPLVVFHHELYSVGGTPLPEPRAVFFVGHRDGLLDKITEHATWLDTPREKSKERSHFREAVTGVDFMGKPIREDGYYSRTIAWWSFDDDLAWTLDPVVGARLATAFLPRDAP